MVLYHAFILFLESYVVRGRHLPNARCVEIPTPTYRNEVGILDGVGVGSDMLGFGFAYVALIRTLYSIFVEHYKMCGLYPTL